MNIEMEKMHGNRSDLQATGIDALSATILTTNHPNEQDHHSHWATSNLILNR